MKEVCTFAAGPSELIRARKNGALEPASQLTLPTAGAPAADGWAKLAFNARAHASAASSPDVGPALPLRGAAPPCRIILLLSCMLMMADLNSKRATDWSGRPRTRRAGRASPALGRGTDQTTRRRPSNTGRAGTGQLQVNCSVPPRILLLGRRPRSPPRIWAGALYGPLPQAHLRDELPASGSIFPPQIFWKYFF